MAIQKQGAGTKPVEDKPAEQPAPEAPDGGFDEALKAILATPAGQPDVPDIAAIVRAELAKLVGSGAFAPQPEAAPEPPKLPTFKKHYRNDLNPDLHIQRLDMSAADRGERPQANPIPGSYIKFRLGHYHTNDDNDIRQLDWMSGRPMYTMDGETLGGNPSIYEDDGEVVFRCNAGCEGERSVFASKKAWKAHMRGFHGMQV